ncbi:MAG: quinate 5-dehydrogenase [Firmicutes bacterium]|nr:quinate 5-dehydrogenase [Dethiobacter sp.]MBS3888783.1 quinate 5-dehydrogenase [Bacillota bacterium]
MKTIISVSLGSSKRDHRVEVELLGEHCVIERIGTDGDLGRAVALIRQLDGKVDAFGMGGIDLYVQAGGKRYILREARQLAAAAQITPIVDGTGLKNTLERKAVRYLNDVCGVAIKGTPVLIVSAADRFGMAETLAGLGAKLTLGDLIFTVGLPVPLYSLRALGAAAKVLAPLLTQLPIRYLYPSGADQERSVSRGAKYFYENKIIAGDFHFIRRYMPDGCQGKIVITNTVTKQDLEWLKQKGVRLLVTTTPELDGRSFGTNVMEALLVALSGQKDANLSAGEYEVLLDRLDFKPRVVELGS